MNFKQIWAKLPVIMLGGSALVFSVGCTGAEGGPSDNGTGGNSVGENSAANNGNGGSSSAGVGTVDNGNQGQTDEVDGAGTGGGLGGGQGSGTGGDTSGNGGSATIGNGELESVPPSVGEAGVDVLNGTELISGESGTIEITITAEGASEVTADLSGVGGGSNETLVNNGNGTWSWTGTVRPTEGGDQTITIIARGEGGQSQTNVGIEVEDVRTLQSGQTVNGSVGRGEYDHYVVDAPIGTAEVSITLNGTGNADLFVKRDQMASSENADFYRTGGSSYESVFIYWCSRPPIVAGSQYYIAVKGNADNSDYTLTATVR